MTSSCVALFRAVQMLVKHSLKHESIKLWPFHHRSNGACIPAASVSSPGFHDHQLFLELLTCCFEVSSSHVAFSSQLPLKDSRPAAEPQP
jgi:hypothetical protein